MTDIVDTIADKLLGDHMALMAENAVLKETVQLLKDERDAAIAEELERMAEQACGECDTLLWNRAKELRGTA